MISGDALVVCLSAVLRLRVAGYYHKYYSYEKYEATIGRGDGGHGDILFIFYYAHSYERVVGTYVGLYHRYSLIVFTV